VAVGTQELVETGSRVLVEVQPLGVAHIIDQWLLELARENQGGRRQPAFAIQFIHVAHQQITRVAVLGDHSAAHGGLGISKGVKDGQALIIASGEIAKSSHARIGPGLHQLLRRLRQATALCCCIQIDQAFVIGTIPVVDDEPLDHAPGTFSIDRRASLSCILPSPKDGDALIDDRRKAGLGDKPCQASVELRFLAACGDRPCCL